jgi:RIO kinase 2
VLAKNPVLPYFPQINCSLDIYKVETGTGEIAILKLARLGRTSFMTIKNKRDYLSHRKNFCWLYLSRLASVKEYLHMQMLYESGFRTPRPIDGNRHGIVMSLIDGPSL